MRSSSSPAERATPRTAARSMPASRSSAPSARCSRSPTGCGRRGGEAEATRAALAGGCTDRSLAGMDGRARQPLREGLRSEASGVGHRLQEAAQGLLYTSESDRPFDPFSLPHGGEGWPYGADEFARRIGAPAGAAVEERPLDQFRARHIDHADPADAVMQGLKPRFEALRTELTSSLRDVRVFRIGSVEVDCY